MKHRLAYIVLFAAFAVAAPGCSVEQLRETLGVARQEAAAIRADAEAVADLEGPDSEAARKVAALAERAEGHVAAIEAKIANAQTWEEVALTLAEYGLAATPFGGLAGVLFAAWRRNRARLNAVVNGLEAAKVDATAAPGTFAVDKGKMRAALADAGVLTAIEAMRAKMAGK